MQKHDKQIVLLLFRCWKFISRYFFIGLMATPIITWAQSTCYETVNLPGDSKFGGGDTPGSKLIGNTYGAGEGPGIYIVADGGYRLYLNGELLAYDNAAGRVRFIPMTFLPGKNAISIVGVNGRGAPGVLMHLDELEKSHVTGAGWKVINSPTDDSWKKESYNDSAWPAATTAANGTLTTLPGGGRLSSPGLPSNSQAKWIWSGSKSDKNVVLRYTFSIKAVGFGALTTGGKRSNIVIVKDETEFLNLLSDTTSRIILIPEGVFDFRNYRNDPNSKVCETPCDKFGTACGTTPATPGLTYKRNITPTTSCAGKYITIKSWDRQIGVTRNKSIIGMGRGASLRGASFYSSQSGNVKNIIFRNLKVWDVNPHIIEAGGGIELINVEKLWVDHCSFKWISDGNDVNHAKEVTYSWDHWDGYNEFQCNGRDFYAALVQDSDVTYDHMYWDGGSGRNPKAYQNTRVHVLNNYHKDNIYAAVSSFNATAQVRVEGNYFEKVCFVTYKTEETSRIYCNKNKYINTAGFLVHQTAVKTEPTDAVFTPPYTYTIDVADSIPALVKARSGAGSLWGTMPRYTDAAGRYNTAPDVTITASSATEVLVTATDGNGIGKVEFYSGIDKIGEVQNAPYKINVGADTCTRSIVAKVYDSKGLATMSLPVTLCRSLIIHKYSVNKGAWVTGSGATVQEGDTIRLSPRPSTISGKWSWKGTGNYTAITREVQLPNISSAQAGVYTASFTDGAACVASADFTITVSGPVKYTLTATATPTAGGTVTGAGTYKKGTVVTVKATPATGYTFTGWSGDVTGTSPSITVTMNGNKSIIANFKAIPVTYTLSTSVTPSAGGTVSGGGTYNAGDVATVKAIAASGYTFTGWSGDATGTSPSITVTMNGNKSITANFKAIPVTYTLSTSVTPSTGGTVSGGGTYNAGDVATVKATPATGYTFTGWSGDVTGTSPSIAVTMNGNKSITANFKAIPVTYTLSTSVTPSTGGTVSGGGTYNAGDVATVKAIPASGYTFTGWSGDVTGTSPSIAVTMNGNKSITANFKVIPVAYTLSTTATPSAGGTVSGGGTYSAGDVATVKAIPASGYTFTGWSGDITGTSPSIAVTMNGNKSITANFKAIPVTYTLVTSANPSAGGTVSGGGTYSAGDVATVKAIAASGYTFTGWSGDATGTSPSITVTMNGNKSITANFKAIPVTYTLSTSVTPSTGGTVSGGGTYSAGDVATVKAIAASGYAFTGWSGDATGTSPSIAVTMNGNKSITANFKAIPVIYTLRTSATPSAGGTVSGGGTYNAGDVATVKATPAAGYTFTGWSGDVTETSPSIAVTMNGNKSITANFKAIPVAYTLSTSVTPSTGGTVSGGGTYNAGDVATVKAIAASGYTFTGWSGDVTGASPSITVMMNGNKSITANFKAVPVTYTLSTTATPSAGGTVSGGGTYNAGDVATVRVIAASGYTFTGWSGDATGTSSSITVTMSGSKSITANFKLTPVTYTLVTSANPSAGGTVSGAGTYNSGDIITIKAISAAGYTFTGWSGDITGASPSVSITMNSNKSVVANFKANTPAKYTISATIEPAGGGRVEGLGSYDPGSEATLKAIAAEGYIFIGWSGDATGTSSSFVTVKMDGNKSVTATFRAVYTLAVTANPSVGGTVKGGGVYNPGYRASIEATPAAGYTFTGWSGDVTGAAPAMDVTMNSNKSIVANFCKELPVTTYILTTGASPSEGGSVDGGGVYKEGTVARVTANPMAEYTFTGWSGDVTGTSPLLDITMDRDKSIVANFEKSADVVKPAKLFSPDNRGDARSETWQFENAHLLDGADIGVYDRQGVKVYSSIGYAVPWDGTSAGKPLPDGAYFYIIVYPDHRKQTGSVTIARLK